VQALLLPVGADRYALELTAIREVVLAPAVTPLPGAPGAVLGVLNLRGDVVPVLDTAALLGTGRVGRVAFAAVAETDHGPAALAADGEPSTAALGGVAGRSELPAGAGRFAVAGGVVTLLDLEALLAPERLAAP
jgi:purine-binding chemotaxis protein CheW